jgi:Rps23 Pro-64 3,4-dihydroxylase Tpa1-like proline 4-hydroxylase
VFFPACVMHEVRPVRCPSRLLADGRFTFNGSVWR